MAQEVTVKGNSLLLFLVNSINFGESLLFIQKPTEALNQYIIRDHQTILKIHVLPLQFQSAFKST